MRPIRLRDEDPPEDAIVVVRAGTMQVELIRTAASFSRNELGVYGLHAYGFADTGLRAGELRVRTKRYQDYFEVASEPSR